MTSAKDVIIGTLIIQRKNIDGMLAEIAAGERKDGDSVLKYDKHVFADNAEFFRQQGFDVWQEADEGGKMVWCFAPKNDLKLTEDELAFAELIGEAQEESDQEESDFPFGDIHTYLRDMIGGLPDILSSLPGRVKVHSIGIIPVGSPSEFFSMMREAMGIPNDESKTDPADTDQKMKEETPAEDGSQEDPTAEDGDQEDPEAQTDEPGEPAE